MDDMMLNNTALSNILLNAIFFLYREAIERG